MASFLRRIFSRSPQVVSSTSLPVGLLREGWKPYRFRGSDIVVLLPQTLVAAFNQDCVLYASSDGIEPEFSATLHTNPYFAENREFAFDFVSRLAAKAGAQVIDVATYRYFADPNVQEEDSKEVSFWVIGIPSAVVVVSLSRLVDQPYAAPINQVHNAIPQIIGELL